MDALAILAVVFVGYALIASKLDRWSVTAPMVFVAGGWLVGQAGLGLVDLAPDVRAVEVVAELTLAVLLFSDASTVRLRDVGHEASLPGRLLGIGLPLTIAAGTLVGGLLDVGGWATAALIAAILAPTDAALGLPVVNDPRVPVRIRRGLNVESGLNDGIASPFVTLFLALVISEEAVKPGSWAAQALADIAVALLVAIVVGGGGGWLAARAKERSWTTALSEQAVVLALGLLAYAGAVAIDGNGFVAAFVAGLLFRFATRHAFLEQTELSENVALLSSYAIWAVFGALFAGPIVKAGPDGKVVVYAILSLTLVRIVPVAIALARGGLRADSVAFVGWFGPRGLASVVFGLVAVESLHGLGPAADQVAEFVTWTVLLSVLAHGISAGPFARLYGRRLEGYEGIETADAPEPRARSRTITWRRQASGAP